jgi:hypothetical protein
MPRSAPLAITDLRFPPGTSGATSDERRERPEPWRRTVGGDTTWPSMPGPFEIEARDTATRIRSAKRGYATRRVEVGGPLHLLDPRRHEPRPGDLALVRIQRIGDPHRLEGTDGRPTALFVGDELLVACGAGYTPHHLVAAPARSGGPCHLVSRGGVVGVVQQRPAGAPALTEVALLGLVAAAEGRALSLADAALPIVAPSRSPAMIATLGTASGVGRAASTAHLVHGLVNAGLRVGACRLTGTAAAGGPDWMRDAGAALVLDFTDAGHASTLGLDRAALTGVAATLLSQLAAADCDVVVAELCGGPLQAETQVLLDSPRVSSCIHGVLLCTGDAMAANASIAWLHARALPVLALAGAISRSAMDARVAAELVDAPVLADDALAAPTTARALLDHALAGTLEAAATR